MKSSKKLQISSNLLFVYINNQDRKWRMSMLVFSSALVEQYSHLNPYPIMFNHVATCPTVTVLLSSVYIRSSA